MNWQLIRDILLFAGGLAGVGYETLGQSTDRPTLLILFAAMMGLPAFLQAESPKFQKKDVPRHRRKKKRTESETEDDNEDNDYDRNDDAYYWDS